MEKKHFLDNVPKIMYGFGDEEQQHPLTQELMNQYLLDFYDKIIREAHKRSYAKGVGNALQYFQIHILMKSSHSTRFWVF